MTGQLQWSDPREYAAALKDEKDLVFLYSGMAPKRYSVLAWVLCEKVKTLGELEGRLSSDKNKFENCWFGYLGYGLRTEFEKISRNEDSYIHLPDLMMARFANVLVFDHERKTITSHCEQYETIHISGCEVDCRAPLAIAIQSNMSDDEYISKVELILEKIWAGELYQCNLTRKFYGGFASEPNGFALFLKLSEISPAPYSAYIKFDGKTIISASPEKFLTVEDGVATTVPIKGTLSSARPADELAASEKDKAENLMIVDLMRNDLSRSCDYVRVEKLFEVTSYAKYHHMSSTITGRLRDSTLDVVRSCFPPGSMTGAPKISAVQLAAELEGIERGVYSGAIGYFGGDGSCDLAVVIRTLIMDGLRFELQVGSGIVADSLADKELEETYVKAAAIFEVLGVKPRPQPK